MTRSDLNRYLEHARARHRELAAGASDSEWSDAVVQELASTLEELQVAQEELHVQHEELAQARALLECERRRYRDLFEEVPEAYLVTSPLGVIQDANLRAATLFATPQRYLTGAPLTGYITESARRTFRQELDMVRREGGQREWTLPVRAGDHAVEAWFRVAAQTDAQGNVEILRWLVSPTGGRPGVEEQFEAIRQREEPDRRRMDADRPPADHHLQFIAATDAALGSMIDDVGSAVILADGGPAPTRVLAASDEQGHALAGVEESLPPAERHALAAGEPVLRPDLTADTVPAGLRDLWRDHEIGAMLAYPFQTANATLGMLVLYGPRPVRLTDDHVAAGQVLAEITGEYLAVCQALTDERRLTSQLQHALDSRVTIEQAKGRLAERLGVTPEAAFEHMRRHARSNNRKLHSVATDVVRGDLDLA